MGGLGRGYGADRKGDVRRPVIGVQGEDRDGVNGLREHCEGSEWDLGSGSSCTRCLRCPRHLCVCV